MNSSERLVSTQNDVGIYRQDQRVHALVQLKRDTNPLQDEEPRGVTDAPSIPPQVQ